MSEEMRQALITLRNVIVAEHPKCLRAEIKIERGMVTIDVHERDVTVFKREDLR